MSFARRVATVAFVLATLTVGSPASAGDAASLRVIGFSDDARYFAFIQYGITDGLGAGYAGLFVIDNSDNSWAEGSPVVFRMDEPAVNQMEVDGTFDQAAAIALEQVLGDGAEILQRYGITGDRPGLTLATRTLFDVLPADRLEFAIRAISPLNDNPPSLQVDLTQQPYDGEVEACYFDYDTPTLYALTLSTDEGQITLSDSETIPASRGCPLGYRLHSVIVSPPDTDQTAMVVLTAVMVPGFEGPSHRFLADGVLLDNPWRF